MPGVLVAQLEDDPNAEPGFFAWTTALLAHPDQGVQQFADSLLFLSRAYSLDSAVARFAERRTHLQPLSSTELGQGTGWAGRVWSHRLGRYQDAKVLVNEALSLLPVPDTSRWNLSLQDALVRSHFWLYESEEVLSASLLARDLAEQGGHLDYAWRFSQWAGRALEVQGEWNDALTHYSRCEAYAERLQEPSIQFSSCLNIACTLYKSGRSEAGLHYLEGCGTKVDYDANQQAVVWLWQGSMFSTLEEYAGADSVFRLALPVFDSLELTDRVVHVLMESAKVALNQGRYQAAITTVQEAYQRVGDDRTPYHELYGQEVLYAAHKGRQDHLTALTHLERLRTAQSRLDSINSSQNIQALAARYEAREQAQIIEQQRLSLKGKRWLSAALILSVLLLSVAAVAIILLLRSRRLVAEKSRTIQQQADSLRRNDEAKTTFFANLAHELRTPLTLLTSPLEALMSEGKLPDREQALVGNAVAGGRQLRQLVNKLLALFKLEAGGITPQLEPIRLRDYITEQVRPFRDASHYRDREFTLTYEAHDELLVELDREKVASIISNLLGNAFRFTPPGHRVSLEVTDTGDELILSVEDEGCGIASEHLDRIFDRYYQVPEGDVKGGTGIGLAIVQEYTHLLGGSLQVQSSPGQGTRFDVHLPRRVVIEDRQQTAVLETAKAANIGSPTNRVAAPHVLVVEDNRELQNLIHTLLGNRYRVSLADDGLQALDLLKSTPVDLVLSDVMMPNMNGLELLEQLRADDATRHLPVVLLTARADLDTRRSALRLGIDDYLVKPFSSSQLLTTLAHLLTRQVQNDNPNGQPSQDTSVQAMSAADAEWLTAFEVYLRKRHRRETLTVARMAHQFAMSESTLLRQLKRLTGLSPAKYLKELRLVEAKQLLDQEGDSLSIKALASRVGYDSAKSFTRSFKQRFGVTPSEYQAGADSLNLGSDDAFGVLADGFRDR